MKGILRGIYEKTGEIQRFLRMGLSEILEMCYNEGVASNRNAHFHCQVSIRANIFDFLKNTHTKVS
mgnify:CR=1 FL=1